jgi:hypothetical protein
MKPFTTFIDFARQFRHLGLAFAIGGKTEVLAPDIYIERESSLASVD